MYQEALRHYILPNDTQKGIEANNTEAIKWFKMSAERGYKEAQLWLAHKYANGQGIKKNEQRAIELQLEASKTILEAREELNKRGIFAPSDAYSFNGYYYKVFYEYLSWPEVFKKCIDQKGYLCTIKSQEEFNFVTSILILLTRRI